MKQIQVYFLAVLLLLPGAMSASEANYDSDASTVISFNEIDVVNFDDIEALQEALENAVFQGDCDRVDYLVMLGADVNNNFSGNGVPLSISIFNHDDPDMVELLLSLGADPNRGHCLCDAIDHGYTEIIAALLNIENPVQITYETVNYAYHQFKDQFDPDGQPRNYQLSQLEDWLFPDRY